MNPHQLLYLTRPTNNFTMGGHPMHVANILIADGKQVPQTLFMDIMVEKTQILIEHVNNLPRIMFDCQYRKQSLLSICV